MLDFRTPSDDGVNKLYFSVTCNGELNKDWNMETLLKTANDIDSVQIKELEDKMSVIDQIEFGLQAIDQKISKIIEKLVITDAQEAATELVQLNHLVATIEDQVNVTIIPMQQWLEKIKNSPLSQKQEIREQQWMKDKVESVNFQKEEIRNQTTQLLILGQQNIVAIQSLRETINELGEQLKQILNLEQSLKELKSNVLI